MNRGTSILTRIFQVIYIFRALIEPTPVRIIILWPTLYRLVLEKQKGLQFFIQSLGIGLIEISLQEAYIRSNVSITRYLTIVLQSA